MYVRCIQKHPIHQGPFSSIFAAFLVFRLALRNTKLLQFYSSLDPRIRTLVYVVRYWGKWKGIAGNMTSGPRISNYALTLMVITYLTNTEPPLLPSVMDLASAAGTTKYYSSHFVNVLTCGNL